MAVQEADSVGKAPACLCVLCGLPGAGKSTLARRILTTAVQNEWRATVVPYDDLIPEHAFRTRSGEESIINLQEMHTEWKSHRQAVLQCIEQFLVNPDVPQSSSLINRTAWEQCTQGLKSDQTPLLFLLDDNFYYPSMRYEVCQLARKRSLGFCQVYLQCDLESCICRNESRSHPVPTEVIVDMVKRLESPNPQKNSWEKHSISLNAADNLSERDVKKVMDLISSALNNPLSPAEDDTEQKEADRLRCANSLIHQADQACRRLISEAMKTARENQMSSEHMRSLAARLNESKATFLHDLRKQFLQEVLYIQEDINVELLVKRAMKNFEEKKNEILSRTINK